MATCKDCLHYDVCTFHITGNEYKRCPHYAPTADVVPRSEVERIFEEIEEARERWEAIYSPDHFGYGGSAYGYLETNVDHTLAELKKKYTEEKQ